MAIQSRSGWFPAVSPGGTDEPVGPLPLVNARRSAGADPESKAVEPLGIVNQNSLARGGVGRPLGEQVQHTAVIDRECGGDVRGLAAGHLVRVRMRPVAAPDQTLWVRRDQGPRERRDIGIIRRGLRSPIGAGNFYVGLVVPH